MKLSRHKTFHFSRRKENCRTADVMRANSINVYTAGIKFSVRIVRPTCVFDIVFNSFYGINKRRRTQFSKRLKRESREKNSFYLEHKCLKFPTPAAVNGHKENSSMSWVFCQKLDSSDVVESPFSVSRCFPTNWLRYQHCSVFTTNFKTFSSVQSSISLSNKRTFHECNPNKTGIRYVTFCAVISEKR